MPMIDCSNPSDAMIGVDFTLVFNLLVGWLLDALYILD